MYARQNVKPNGGQGKQKAQIEGTKVEPEYMYHLFGYDQ